MGFAELRRSVDEGEGFQHDQRIAEPIVYLSTPGAIVYIYFNGGLDRSDRAIDDIVARYRTRHPKTHFEPRVIAEADLQARRYFAFPRTEQLFFQQGYAAEFDARSRPIGRATTAYLREQKSVLHVQTFILAEILRHIGPSHFGWLVDFIESKTPESQRAIYMQHRLADQLAPLTGITSGKANHEPIRYAMVDREDFLLGKAQLLPGDRAHMAFSGTPESWIKSANQALQAGYLGERRAEDIRRQIERELSNTGIAAFFGRGVWNGHDGPVSAFALAAWQSQAIASLRKLLWRAESEESQSYLKNELKKERQILQDKDKKVFGDPIGAGRIPVGSPKQDFRGVFADAIGKFGDRFAGPSNDVLDDNISVTVTDRNIIVGALCCSGVDLRIFDEKPDSILELCQWVAHLRKTGRASINGGFAFLLDEVMHDPRTELSDLIYAAFADEVWRCILDAADSVKRTDITVLVSYSWGTIEMPWSARRQGNELFITGALLYLPIADAPIWERFGQAVAANGGFEAN